MQVHVAEFNKADGTYQAVCIVKDPDYTFVFDYTHTKEDTIALQVYGDLAGWWLEFTEGETDPRKYFGPAVTQLEPRTLAYMIRDCYLNE